MAVERSVCKMECYLVRDLLIPYAAGDASQQTRAWVEQHVAGCEPCREAFAEAIGLAAMPATPQPPVAPSQRLLKRVRITVIGTVALIAILIMAVGGLTWSISQVKRLANMPEDHAVPTATVSAREAVSVDLSPLGLERAGTAVAETGFPGFTDGAEARYTAVDGTEIQLSAYRFTDARTARRFESDWEERFRMVQMRLTSRNSTQSATKFHSGGAFYYTWSKEGWFVVLQVPESAPDPTTLRDQIRDLLLIHYTH